MLDVDGIDTFYGLGHILFDVSLHVGAGEVVCVLGRNGAGKTTTLKSIMGVVAPRQGRIRYKDADITGQAPFMLARKGIGYVPDDRRIFADLMVAENLEIAARGPAAGRGAGGRGDGGRGGDGRVGDGRGAWDEARIYGLFPVLGEKRRHKGGHLSGGEQKMLAIARALMGNPELLLLDEPMEGLAPLLVRAVEEQVVRLKAEGLTVLLAEQNVQSALRLCDRCYVIDDGRIRYQGTARDLRDNDEIRRKYLFV
jgi:branched-chain amino acid transport system ATP-binding protein